MTTIARLLRLGVILSFSVVAYESVDLHQDAPRILYDTSPQAVDYQLRRLGNEQLARVERNETDVKYRPVYLALLTRKGLGREYFDEALAALRALDKASTSAVLMRGLARTPADDEETASKLLRTLFSQSPEALRRERDLFTKVTAESNASPALRGAYGALMLSDGRPQSAWDEAMKREGHLAELLRSVPHLGKAQALRDALRDPIARLLTPERDASTRAAAVAALGSTTADATTFRTIAREALESPDAEVRAAAVRALQRFPRAGWPAAEVEPLARSIVAGLAKLPPAQRGEPSTVEAIQLAEKLADALPDDSRRAARRELRALGVQVVRIETVPEQMMFDLKWFAVEAGKPVQIVLSNPDAMPHNLLITKPGALKEVGMAATTMTLSSDAGAKPYVPDTPLVLQATRLLNWGETERLSFPAPKEPGEYPFVCTFPGHWVRMYGVMLVVPDLDAWEAKRTVPTDPMTSQPFPSQR